MTRPPPFLGECRPQGADGRAAIAPPQRHPRRDIQLTLFGAPHPLLDKLREVDCDQLTPLAALGLIKELAGE